MSKITSIISCKGGVGKTTSAVNISSYIHTQGKRVLAVDLDYQHNLSKHFGIFPGHLKDKPTVYDLFNAAMDDCSDDEMNELVHNAIVKSTTVDVLPATAKLSLLDKVLPTATCREYILKGILKHIKNEYDYIFIDCHPGCDLFAINALTVSDTVSSSNVDRSKLAPGDLIIFGTAENSHTHIAVYSGTYKGTDFLIHVGNDRGPEIMPVAWMSQAGDKSSYPNAYYHLPSEFFEDDGTIEIYKKDTEGK